MKRWAALGLSQSRLRVGGHSLGALIALHWAARHQAQMEALTLWSAPLFRDAHEANAQLKQMGTLEALFAHDSTLARISCEVMCSLRPVARALAVVLSPDLPLAISAKAVSHTWPAYHDAMQILYADWSDSLRTLSEARIPITLMAGTCDPSQVPGLARELAATYAGVRQIPVAGAKHILPLTHGAACAWELAAGTNNPRVEL